MMLAHYFMATWLSYVCAQMMMVIILCGAVSDMLLTATRRSVRRPYIQVLSLAQFRQAYLTHGVWTSQVGAADCHRTINQRTIHITHTGPPNNTILTSIYYTWRVDLSGLTVTELLIRGSYTPCLSIK
jgi:hypothetical protein